MMNGRDLIVYILQNGLENEPILKGDKIIGFLSEKELAIKFNTGVATVNALIEMGKMDKIIINGQTYIPAIPSPTFGGINEKKNS